MDVASWQTLERLFAEAVELPEDRRAGFCDRACADDLALHAELTSLLRAHGADAGLLERPANALGGTGPAPLIMSPGTRVGVWCLGALIRRGGAGEVYFATRADGAFDQQVALKLLYRDAAGWWMQGWYD